MKTGKGKKNSKKSDKSGKSGRVSAPDRKARLKAAKGDGTFPDRIIVTKEHGEKNAEGKSRSHFAVHKEELDTLHNDGQQVAVYKLVRVSSLIVKRKIALNRA